MSLISQGRGVSPGALGGLGVVGSRCLGSTGPALRISGPFPFTAPSLFCSAPPFQLQPKFHQGAGFVGRGVRLGGERGHRDRASFPGVLQSPLCYPQGHRELATGHRFLAPQRLGGVLLFSHGDYPVSAPVSPSRGLDGIPGPPGCLLPGSGPSSFLPLPEVLRGGCGVPVSSLVLRSLDGPSGVHPPHGSCLFDYASSRFPSAQIPRRLVSPGLLLPGHCASEAIVPGARLRMRSLQLRLNALGPLLCDEDLVSWDDGCLRDLRWWSDDSHLLVGLPLGEALPDLFLYSDASNQGWGAALGGLHLSGLWSPLCSSFSINQRELLTILYVVQSFLPYLLGHVVALYSDNSTALAYLRKQGGTRSSTLNAVAQELLRLCESQSVRLLPQFIPSHLNVLADSLSRRSQVLGSEWTLCPQAVRSSFAGGRPLSTFSRPP